MRFVKLFGLSVFFLLLVMVAITSVMPAHLRMSRAIDIRCPRTTVFDTINNLRSWPGWNGFIMDAPLTHLAFSGTARGAGARLESDQLTITITESSLDSIATAWSQLHGKHFTGGFNLYQLRPDVVTVQCYFDFRFRWYPWEKLSSLLYEKQLGPVMEGSLTNLKKQLER